MKLNYSKISVLSYATFLVLVTVVCVVSVFCFSMKGWFNAKENEAILGVFLYMVMMFLSIIILAIFALDYRRQTKHRVLMNELKLDIQNKVEESTTIIQQSHKKEHSVFFVRQGKVYSENATKEILILNVEDIYFDKICYISTTGTSLAIGTDAGKNIIIFCNIQPNCEWTKIV